MSWNNRPINPSVGARSLLVRGGVWGLGFRDKQNGKRGKGKEKKKKKRMKEEKFRRKENVSRIAAQC
jgi:hypothetical protein